MMGKYFIMSNTSESELEPKTDGEIEKMIAEYFGWVKYDQPEDYEMSAFGGMWVGDDGKTGYNITALVTAINKYVSDRERVARVDELERCVLYWVKHTDGEFGSWVEKRKDRLRLSHKDKDK